MKSTVVRETEARSAILQLDQFLPYLFHLITAGLSNRFLERLRENGVTVNRWRVLMVIMSKGPRNMTELMKLTLIPQSALSRLIDQMERDRLVVRRPSREDTRRVEVELTDHGRQMYWRLLPTAETHAAIIVEGFAEDEREILDKLLRRVLANLQIDALSGVDPADDTNRTIGGAQRKVATSVRPTRRRRPRSS
jgi:MarR family transcriptional regulator, organic hydroperoxide resistance regulator